MLIPDNSHLFVYAITRDFGFAPNPFHGYCSLATCKPRIRKSASVGDWVMGVGGSKLKSVKERCIFLMRVSEKISFQQYWEEQRFSVKKPARNGSRVQMLGDNIYHKNGNNEWIQEDSHHSQSDGSPHAENMQRDTGFTDQVLISDCFYYFGSQAVEVDLAAINFHRIRDYKKYNLDQSTEAREIITELHNQYLAEKNTVISDPVQFLQSHKRADQSTGVIT